MLAMNVVNGGGIAFEGRDRSSVDIHEIAADSAFEKRVIVDLGYRRDHIGQHQNARIKKDAAPSQPGRVTEQAIEPMRKTRPAVAGLAGSGWHDGMAGGGGFRAVFLRAVVFAALFFGLFFLSESDMGTKNLDLLTRGEGAAAPAQPTRTRDRWRDGR